MLKRLTILLSILALTACQNKTAFVFSYFDTIHEEAGLCLAYSYDGYHWTPLNDNKPILAPTVGKDKLMRDPSICQAPDGTFHMVWTTSWHEDIIGYASSPDLIHWSEQRAIPVMTDYPSVRNCWAPELFYNKEEGVYYIMWASIVPDNEEVDRSGSEKESGGGHRVYCTTTTDFKEFSPTRLYFNSPYSSIDAAVVQDPVSKDYIMVIKDDPEYIDMHVSRTRSMAQGFPTKMVSAISDSDNKEGPSPLFINKTDLLVFFDRYMLHQYGAVLSRDHGDTWEDVTGQIEMPEGMSHGTAIRVDRKVVEKLKEAFSNPAAYLKTDEQRATAASLRNIKDGHLYKMDYTADYKLDELMAQGGAKSNEELIAKVFKGLLNLPAAASESQLDYGCSAFCVKSPEGDVLVGRNFDYRFVSSANVVVHNLASAEHESMCISAMPYLDADTYVAGSLSDGTTDISVPTVASIYCCLDGMNDAGLFIGVLSLRGGGAVQHDPAKSDIMTALAIRLSLDKCANIEEALDVFSSHNFFADGEDSPSNYHFLIADASGKSVVVEYYRPGEDAPVEDAKARDWTLNVLDEDHVTNFYLTEGWQNLGVGQARYDSLHTTLERTRRIMTEDECMDLLNVVHTDLNSEGGEITSNTQWSVVYNLTKKTATVCVDKDYETKLHFSL